MHCEKCAGTMEPRRLFRLSGCLVASGYGLLVTAVAAVLFAVLLAVVGPRATTGAAADHEARAKADAIAALRKSPGDLPAAVYEEFASGGAISDRTLSTLPFDQQSTTRSVMAEYHRKRAASGIATLATAGIGGLSALILFVFGITASIVALLLVRKRKVWRCTACGFAFERT